MNRNNKQLQIAYLVSFVAGAAGLIYEVSWHRYLANLIGSEARATSFVLAVFLAGLSIGYRLFGRISEARLGRSAIKLAGLLEIIIGIWALFYPKIYNFIWGSIGVLPTDSSFAFVSDLAICFLLMAVPTIMMGGTLPLLTQGLSPGVQESSSLHAKIYSLNTAGAFLGCLLAGFILIPSLGLPLTVLYTAVVSLVCGVLLLVAAEASNENSPNNPVSIEEKRADPTQYKGILFVSFISGYVSISLQTILVRLIALSLGSSEYAFCTVVAAFILTISLGAWRISKADQKSCDLTANLILIVIGLSLLYIIVPYWPYAGHVIRSLFTSVKPNFWIYYSVILIALSVVCYYPLSAMGATLPILFTQARNDRRTLGKIVGKIYGYNTLGCVSGAIIGGYLALYYFNLDQLLKSLIVIVLLTTYFASADRNSKRTAALIMYLLVIYALPAWNKLDLSSGTFRARAATAKTFSGARSFYDAIAAGRRLIDYKDDPNTTVSVIEAQTAGRMSLGHSKSLSLYVNGKSDGATSGMDLRTTRLLAHLPALLARDIAGEAAVVGFGTGITVGSLSLYQQIQMIDVIEIAPSVKKFAAYFDPFNQQLTASKKISWYERDAYRILASAQKQYQIIISEPSNPWVTGVERLFSKDFYELAKKRLASNGVYAQWFHTYDLSPETIGIVLKTFYDSFDHVRIFALNADLILLGSSYQIDLNEVEQAKSRFLDPVVQNDIKQLEINTLNKLLSFEVSLPKDIVKRFPVHSLEFPKLAFRAGYDHFRGEYSQIESLLYSEVELMQSKANAKNLLMYKINLSQEDQQLLYHNLCDQILSDPSEQWNTLDLRCKRLLASQLINSNDLSYDYIKDLRLLRAVFNSHVSNLNDIQDQDLISLYSKYSYPLLKLPVEPLITKAKSCKSDDNQCYMSYIKILAIVGYYQEAANLVLQRSNIFKKSELEYAKWLVAQSARLWSIE